MRLTPSPESQDAIGGPNPMDLWARMRLWWTASADVQNLTRNWEQEERIRAEAALRLNPNPAALADLFRPHIGISSRSGSRYRK